MLAVPPYSRSQSIHSFARYRRQPQKPTQSQAPSAFKLRNELHLPRTISFPPTADSLANPHETTLSVIVLSVYNFTLIIWIINHPVNQKIENISPIAKKAKSRYNMLCPITWRGVRVVEGAWLEIMWRGNSSEGSNPSLSAKQRNPTK